jgi:hypothetical protein
MSVTLPSSVKSCLSLPADVNSASDVELPGGSEPDVELPSPVDSDNDVEPDVIVDDCVGVNAFDEDVELPDDVEEENDFVQSHMEQADDKRVPRPSEVSGLRGIHLLVEYYSPPRITKAGAVIGLASFLALDIVTGWPLALNVLGVRGGSNGLFVPWVCCRGGSSSFLLLGAVMPSSRDLSIARGDQGTTKTCGRSLTLQCLIRFPMMRKEKSQLCDTLNALIFNEEGKICETVTSYWCSLAPHAADDEEHPSRLHKNRPIPSHKASQNFSIRPFDSKLNFRTSIILRMKHKIARIPSHKASQNVPIRPFNSKLNPRTHEMPLED